MSVSYIPDPVKFRLWAKAAGRCQYEGCNDPLWLDTLTKSPFNTAYIAHIIADKPDGPRGDTELSGKLGSDFDNLMLMCDQHHRLIDKEDVEGHPVERLQEMKRKQEARIEILTSVAPEMQSEVFLYYGLIGNQAPKTDWQTAAAAMIPKRYPLQSKATEIGMTSCPYQDHQAQFWNLQYDYLKQEFDRNIGLHRNRGELPHISLFALGTQPLLMALGALLGEIQDLDIYQPHRVPKTWKWLEGEPLEYQVVEPDEDHGVVALNLSLSANIAPERIHQVLGEDASIWTISVPETGNDILRSADQLIEFQEIIRDTINRINHRHDKPSEIHIFPACPASVAVEIGRCRMPKADPALKVWDQNNKAGGFIETITIGGDEK